MSRIYIESRTTSTRVACKIIAYDTENLRECFLEMKDLSDKEIKKYLEENDGNIYFKCAHNGETADLDCIMSEEMLEDTVEYTRHRWEESPDEQISVFFSNKDWDGQKYWLNTAPVPYDVYLKGTDNNEALNNIMENFLNTLNLYSFSEK